MVNVMGHNEKKKITNHDHRSQNMIEKIVRTMLELICTGN